MKFNNRDGSVTALVLVTILFFVTILSATYIINGAMRKSQLRSEMELKQIYENQLNDVDNIYNSMVSE